MRFISVHESHDFGHSKHLKQQEKVRAGLEKRFSEVRSLTGSRVEPSNVVILFMFPQVINIPLVDDEDVVDTATLRDAKPLGILRVVATWQKLIPFPFARAKQ